MKKAKILCLCLLIIFTCSSVLSCADTKDNPTGGETENITEGEVENITSAPAANEVSSGEPRFPEYVRPEEYLEDPVDYKGTMHVVIGKNGCLYENGYINELYGFAQKYVNTTDEQLQKRVDRLRYIQDCLEDMGVAFCVVITPNKAADYKEYIPDFYMEDQVQPEGYIRPYIRFKKMLEDTGVYLVDSQTVYKKAGLTNTFPKTGIHWNKLAAFETINAIVDQYITQTGREAKHLLADEIITKTKAPGFGNPEMDIFGIVYSGQKRAVKDSAIVDEYYYWPDVYEDTSTDAQIKNVIIQGGSFTGDFFHYFNTYNIASKTIQFYYNNGGDMNIDWDSLLSKSEFMIMEVNEQFVYGMGGYAPSWAEADLAPAKTGGNIIDALYDHLSGN